MKTFLLITIIMLSIIASNAQVSLGIKAGLNLSSINNIVSSGLSSEDGNLTSSKMKLGEQLGVYANIHFSKLLGFQPELLFSIKGFKSEYTKTENIYGGVPPNNYTTSHSKSNLSLNYIEIPLQLRINPTKNFFILTGPYLGILARASTARVYSDGRSRTDIDYSWSYNNGKQFKSLDYGIALGLGVMTKKKFTMGLKYLRGLTSIYSINTKMQNVNSVFQFFVGYEFREMIIRKKCSK